MGRSGEVAHGVVACRASIPGTHAGYCNGACSMPDRESHSHCCVCGRGSQAAADNDFIQNLTMFVMEMTDILHAKAKAKGYARDSNGRATYDAIAQLVGGQDAQACSEIISKVVRWQAKQNPEDLVKIAAWAFLMWDADRRSI